MDMKLIFVNEHFVCANHLVARRKVRPYNMLRWAAE